MSSSKKNDPSPQGPDSEKKTDLEIKRFWTWKKLVLGLFLFPVVMALLIVLLNVLLYFYPLSYPKRKLSKKGDLRVMTFNLAHGRGVALFPLLMSKSMAETKLDEIASFLKDYQPDVVGLQELDANCCWSGGFDHLDYLKKKANFSHSFYSPNVKVGGWYYMDYGNGILSQKPLANSRSIPFGSRSFMQKGFLITEIKGLRQPLRVVNLHLDFKSSIRRMKQAQSLIETLKGNQKKVPTGKMPLIMGDFNAEPGGKTLEKLVTDLGYSTANLYPKKGHTFSIYWPDERIDLILLPPFAKSRRCEVIEATLSDHYPVLLDLEFTSKSEK